MTLGISLKAHSHVSSRRALGLAICLAASLAACGGGGGGSSTPPASGPGTAPLASVAPSSLTFTATATGTTSAAQTVTLSNTGTAPLSLSAIATDSATFVITPGGTCAAGSSIAAGASCTALVAFAPNAATALMGNLTFSHNASPSTTAVVLAGTGVAAGSPINTTPQMATYTAGSPEALAFAQLNEERGACGFGFLKQSAKLDLAAQDANAYLVARAAEGLASARAYIHVQTGGKSGFTGQFPSDRAAFRGYTFSSIVDVNEDNSTLFSQPASALTNPALALTRLGLLLTSVYHVSGLMTSRTEVGTAFVRTTTSDGYDVGRLELMVGAPTGDRRQVAPSVRTYPCAGTTRVYPTFVPSNESPNPAPDLGTATVGTPVYINGPEGQTIAVTSATITPAGGSPLANRIITYDNDPVFVSTTVHALTPNEAFILPLVPLAKGTTYTVAVAGTSNGAPFARTFSFTPSL